MGIFVEIDAGEGGQLGSALAELENFFDKTIFSRGFVYGDERTALTIERKFLDPVESAIHQQE